MYLIEGYAASARDIPEEHLTAWNVVWPHGSEPVTDDGGYAVRLPDGQMIREHEAVSIPPPFTYPDRADAGRPGRDPSQSEAGLAEAWDECGAMRPLLYLFEVADEVVR